MRVALLVNPVAGRGRTAAKAPEMAALIREITDGDTELHVTEEPGHAVQIARDAVRDGIEVLFVLGGDGTVHEALNGVADPLHGVPAATVLAPLDGGTGGDAVRNLVPGLRDEEIVRRALAGQTRLVDVGRVRFLRLEFGTDERGALPVRLFLNCANIGLGSAVAGRMAVPSLLPIPRAWTYPRAVLAEIVRGTPLPLSLSCDGETMREIAAWNVAFANGAMCGGGLPMAPSASLDDGLLSLVTIGATSRGRALRDLPRLRAGTHAALPYVAMRAVRAVHVTATDSLMIEADGEWLGETPCTVDILPRAVRVVQ